MLAFWSAAVFILCFTALLVVGRSLARRAFAGLCLLAASAIPMIVDIGVIARTGLTLLSIVALVKCVQIAFSQPEWWTPGRRIWSAVVPFDVRRTQRVPPGFDLNMTARVVTGALVSVFVLWFGLAYSDRLLKPFDSLSKIACGLIFTYAFMEFVAALIRLLHRLAGIAVDPLQRDPILSRSVSEFWGERWNLPISQWLNEFFFRPLARRGKPLTGVAAAFLVSTALHAWLFFAAVGWKGSALASAFFLLQIPAVLLERRFEVRKWPAPVGRIWTLTFLLGSSALFVLPLTYGLQMRLAGK